LFAGKITVMFKRKVLFERIPGVFATLYEKASRMVRETYYVKLAEEIVGQLQEGRILDLGTGPGYLPIEVVKKAPGLEAVGIDLSSKLIRMAQENAQRAGVGNRVRFRTGQASDAPFPDNSFDMVISTGMLHMVKDPVRIFRECHRLVKPGGQVWILDPAQVSSQVDREKWWASLSWKEKIAYQVFKLFSKINPGKTYRREEVEIMLQEIPFAQCRLEESKGEIEIKCQK
jgi:ubiquinone/menaquinone biosynthesis C-methylase UbiE